MQQNHQNLREICMHPKYKSNSNKRSQHVYLSFIFSQEFPGKKCSTKMRELTSKKGMDPTNKSQKESPGWWWREIPRQHLCRKHRDQPVQMGPEGGLLHESTYEDKMKLMATLGICTERNIYPSGTEFRDELGIG